MKNKEILQLGGRQVTVTTAASSPQPVVYANVFAEKRDELISLVDLTQLTLVTIDSVAWNRDFSPWPAPRAFPQGENFAGQGPAYVQELTHEIVPAVEEYLSFVPVRRIIAGYSLAGLFALYALYECNIFKRAVCASPSLWYDNFLEYMQRHEVVPGVDKVYFSLGDREAKTRNKRLARVATAIHEGTEILTAQGITTTFELNKGNHFVNTMPRLAKGIAWAIA